MALRRVSNPGGGVIPGGRSWNEMIQRLEALERALFRDGSREAAMPIMHNRAWMWAENNTGQQLGDRAILQITSTVVPNSQDAVVGVGLPMDCSKVVIGFKPNPAASRRLMCIVVSGYALADVNVQQEHLDDPEWNCSATVVIGDHTQLISDLKGGVQIMSPVVAAGLQEVVVRVGNSASCNVPTQDEFEQKCQEVDDLEMELNDLKDCLCDLADNMEADGDLTTATADIFRACIGCDDPPTNPVNETCPNCPVPQFMNINVAGDFPWRLVTGGFPAVQELRWQELGAGTGVATAIDNTLVEAAFETLLLAQWNYDSGGGCTYPNITKTMAVSIPVTIDPDGFGGLPAFNGTIDEIRVEASLGNPTGINWEWQVASIQMDASDGNTYFANTPNGDALGPAITADGLDCAVRGQMPNLFANSGGLIDIAGTGQPFIVWDLQSVEMTQPA